MDSLSKMSAFSKKRSPELYVVPVKRKIKDSTISVKNKVKIAYANFEMKVPCKNILNRFDSYTGNKESSISFDICKGKGISIKISDSILGEKENRKRTSFESYDEMLRITPIQIEIYNLKNVDSKKYFLLLDKLCFLIRSTKIYKFERYNVRGFQFINLCNKNKRISVEIFDHKNKRYCLGFDNFSQREIDYILASIRFKKPAK